MQIDLKNNVLRFGKRSYQLTIVRDSHSHVEYEVRNMREEDVSQLQSAYTMSEALPARESGFPPIYIVGWNLYCEKKDIVISFTIRPSAR